MSAIKFKRGLSSNLSNLPVEDGSLIITTDDKAVYLDVDDDRIKIGSDNMVNNDELIYTYSYINSNDSLISKIYYSDFSISFNDFDYIEVYFSYADYITTPPIKIKKNLDTNFYITTNGSIEFTSQKYFSIWGSTGATFIINFYKYV